MRLRQTLLTLSVAALPFAQRAEAEGAARPNILRAAVPDLFDDPLFESVFKAALDRYAERDYGGAEKQASRIASEARASAKERVHGATGVDAAFDLGGAREREGEGAGTGSHGHVHCQPPP